MKMLALADCLGVDVPYLMGDMEARHYDEQALADRLGIDPGAIALLLELKPEIIDGIRVENGSTVMSEIIVDMFDPMIRSDYERLVKAYMCRRLCDDPQEAEQERERVEQEIRLDRFELVESFSSMLRQRYEAPTAIDDYLSDKGKQQLAEQQRQQKVKEQRHAKLIPPERIGEIAQHLSTVSRTVESYGKTIATIRNEAAARIRQQIADH
ncbi:hypothetical protein CSQ87_00570 [Bifidobacterium simiarum]|uniref:Uncharacterized protein n=2 Tax=Bifidobacterium simiarum TaxID=2045441 RepID=A0A2M9HGY0_9BIFI|nr:hypothetical protein CSQ87_00570 [Bifidobacterium simiarum]